VDVLLVAAFHPELAPLAPVLGEATARVAGASAAARVVGIGLPMAAVGAAMLLGELQPRAVILVGTCGAYIGSDLAIGDVITARRVRLVDPGVVAATAQFPEPMSVAIDAHASLAAGLEATGAHRVDVATTLAITVDDAAAGAIAHATRAQVEHMEAYGVAVACAARGVPFGALLGVANFVGARGRGEWRAHHTTAAAAAADRVVHWLTQVRPVRDEAW
jgi:nucleoside phosphorylase